MTSKILTSWLAEAGQHEERAGLMAFWGLFQKKKEKEEKPSLAELGYAFDTLYSASDFGRYNPDSLQLNKGTGVYDRMLADDQVKAVLQFKQHAITSRGFYFEVKQDPETGEEDKGQREIADFLSFAVRHMKGSFTDNLLEVLSALKYGFAVLEKIYTSINYEGRPYWGLLDMKLRPFDSFNGGFVTDKHGNLERLIQKIGLDETELPLDKIVHFVHQPDVDRHYGESDLKTAYRAWWSKDICIKFYNIYLERSAGGFIHASIDKEKGSLTPDQVTNLKAFIENITAASGIMTPAAVDINQHNPTSTDAFEKAIAAYDKAIAKSLLVPNLLGLSEQGQTGSYSQSQTQIESFFWVLDAISARVEETLNEDVFRDLVKWNFATEDFPLFRFEPISDEKKAKLAQLWTQMVKDGAVVSSDTDEQWIRDLVGAPEKMEEPEPEQNPEDMLPVEEPAIDDWLVESGVDLALFEDKPWLKRINFEKLERMFDAKDEALIRVMLPIMVKIKNSIDQQVIKIGGERSWSNVKPNEIVVVAIPKNLLIQIRKTLRIHLNDAVDDSYMQARKELPKKFFKRVGPGMDKTQIERFLTSRSMKITGTIEQDILDAVQLVLENAIKYDKSLKDTITALEENTDLVKVLPKVDSAGRAVNIPARLETIARTNIADAVNQARLSLFGDPELKGFVQAYEYSAILDSRTTDICEHLHGKVLKDFGVYVPPNHFNCRSVLVPVTEVDDWNGKESAKPRLKPQKDFD